MQVIFVNSDIEVLNRTCVNYYYYYYYHFSPTSESTDGDWINFNAKGCCFKCWCDTGRTQEINREGWMEGKKRETRKKTRKPSVWKSYINVLKWLFLSLVLKRSETQPDDIPPVGNTWRHHRALWLVVCQPLSSQTLHDVPESAVRSLNLVVLPVASSPEMKLLLWH